MEVNSAQVGSEQLFVVPPTAAPTAGTRDTVVIDVEFNVFSIEGRCKDFPRHGDVTPGADGPNERTREQYRRDHHDCNRTD